MSAARGTTPSGVTGPRRPRPVPELATPGPEAARGTEARSAAETRAGSEVPAGTETASGTASRPGTVLVPGREAGPEPGTRTGTAPLPGRGSHPASTLPSGSTDPGAAAETHTKAEDVTRPETRSAKGSRPGTALPSRREAASDAGRPAGAGAGGGPGVRARAHTGSRSGTRVGGEGAGGEGAGGDGAGCGGRSWAADPYADALGAERGPLFLRRTDGWLLPLEVERWCARADAVDLQVLAHCEGTVLDLGCGPGRLVAELAALGRPALGIDVSEAAVARTVRLGGQALRRSVFEPLPGEGRWGTALLVDGNIGIGGDPAALLRRTAQLLAPGGLLIAETVAGADVDERVDVRIVSAAHPGDAVNDAAREDADAREGGPSADRAAFPWARVGTPALLRHAVPAGWRTDAQWEAGGRSFVALRNGPGRDGRRDRRTSSSADPANSAAVISSQWARKLSPGRAVADR